MNNSKPVNPCKVITGKDTRLSYEHVWEPASINGGNPKYSACVMWPKTDEVTTRKVNDAIEAAYREGESRLKGSGKAVPPMTAIKNPLRDGDLDRPEDPAKPYLLIVDVAVRERGRRDPCGYFPHGLYALLRHTEFRPHPDEPGKRLAGASCGIIFRNAMQGEGLFHDLKPREAHVSAEERIKLIEPRSDVPVLRP